MIQISLLVKLMLNIISVLIGTLTERKTSSSTEDKFWWLWKKVETKKLTKLKYHLEKKKVDAEEGFDYDCF